MYLHHRPHRLLLDIESSSLPTNGQGGKARSASTYMNEARFDSNMIVILAALLCALICALGLNSIMRCALRCSRRFDAVETPDETAARLASTGLKRSRLRQIPVVVYGSSELNMSPSTDCPICLGEFRDGEKVRILPECNHGFHVRCIDTWFMSHSSCPTCRRSLLDYPTCTVAGVAPLDVRSDSGGGVRNGDEMTNRIPSVR